MNPVLIIGTPALPELDRVVIAEVLALGIEAEPTVVVDDGQCITGRARAHQLPEAPSLLDLEIARPDLHLVAITNMLHDRIQAFVMCVIYYIYAIVSPVLGIAAGTGVDHDTVTIG
jgi:hypothetical protein